VTETLEAEQRERLVESERHHTALLETEIRCLERTLRTYRVLTTDQLAELSGANRWRRGRLREALDAGVNRGVFARRGRNFVELPPDRG
jgi:hypothetical protein